jgi:hypothetical protein
METVHRPFGISVLVFLGALSGAFGIFNGVLLMLDRDDAALQQYSFTSETQLTFFAIAVIAFGVVQLLLAVALEKGSEIVRILYALVAVLNLGWAVWGVVALHSEQRFGSAIHACVALLVLYLLFNARAEQFFEESKRNRA